MDAALLTATLLTAGLAAAAVAAYQQLRVFAFWSSRGVAGPAPWPFLGTNVYYLFKNKTALEAEWHARYGHSYGCYDGLWPQLRTTDTELIKHVCVKDFAAFTDRYNVAVHGPVQKRWLLWSPGDLWANQRALISPMFTAAKLRAMLGTVRQCSEALLDEIARKAQGTGAAVIERAELMSCALDSVARSLFGVKLDAYAPKSSEFARRAFAISRFSVARFAAYLLMPLRLSRLLAFDLTPYAQFEYFDKLVQSVLRDKARRAAGPADAAKTAPTDFVQMLLDARIPDQYRPVYSDEDAREAHFNDNVSTEALEQLHRQQCARPNQFRAFDELEIRGQTTFLFIAGFETTSSALSFGLYELAHHPRVQQELHDEIEQALAGRPIERLELAELAGLRKLDAFVSETLRMHGIVTENNRMVTDPLGRCVPVNGRQVHLPQGTVVSYNAHLVHRHPDHWPEPDKLDIARFYRENRHRIKSCAYLPFGVGPRNCAGMRLALLNIKLVLANLVLNCRIAPGPRTAQYPPSYRQHAFFLQLVHDDVRVEFRESGRQRRPLSFTAVAPPGIAAD